MREYVGAAGQAARVEFLPGDPPRLVAVGFRGACVWEVGRPDPVATLPLSGEHPRSAEPVGSADRRWLALLPGGRVALHDLRSGGAAFELGWRGAVAARFTGRPERLSFVSLTRLEGRAALTFDSWLVPALGRTFDAREVTSRVLASPWEGWPGDGPGWESYDLSADGRRAAVSYRQEAVHVWDTDSGAVLRAAPLTGLPKGMAFSPDGSKIVIDVGTVYVHDESTLKVLVKWKAKYSYAPGLAWSPDGRLLARTDDSTTVRLFDAGTGRQVAALGTKRGRYTSVAFAPDGLTFAAGAVDGTVRVWDVG